MALNTGARKSLLLECWQRPKNMLRRLPSPLSLSSVAAELSVETDNPPSSIAFAPSRVEVSKSSSSSSAPSVLTHQTRLVDSLLDRTADMVNVRSANIIAYSGGVDSSLTAALVHRTFTSHPSSQVDGGSVKAVLGLSPAVPSEQITTARSVARAIGIELLEIQTEEGSDPTYISNTGEACLACKTHLYSALSAVASHAAASSSLSEGVTQAQGVILYNGTNADDKADPTRVGLIAAANFSVASPLINTTKAEVREAARHLGLPNWDYAAAPCLRSRLALGVSATADHLRKVEKAERQVRDALNLDHRANLRVRVLAGRRAMVELDQKNIENSATETLKRAGFDQFFSGMGFASYGVREFRSGSVAKAVQGSSRRSLAGTGSEGSHESFSRDTQDGNNKIPRPLKIG